MPPTTRRASAAQNASTTADDAQPASDGVRRAEEGGGDDGGKKRKTSSRNEEGEADEVGTRRDFFSTLPLDLFYQICGQLHPGTLLAIAQTSKSIRSTLFRKSAAPVWRAARRSAGLDALSGKLDEPTYAYLLYGKACQVCGTTKRETAADFDLQVRACAKCFERNICLATSLEESIDKLHPLTFQCCLSTPFSHKGKRSVSRKPFYWKPEVVATSALLREIDPVAARTDRRKAHPSRAALDLKRDFDDYAGPVEADSWAFPDCVARVEEQRLQEEKERPILRFKQIQIRLMNAGFDKVDTLAVPLSVKNSLQPVDEDYWALVKDDVIKAVQEARDERMEKGRRVRKAELLMIYEDLYQATPTAEQHFFPSMHAYLGLSSVKPLLNLEDGHPSSCYARLPVIRLDVQHRVRIDKIRYFDQLARVLLSVGIALPSSVVGVLEAERSPLLDEEDGSQSVAPLHDRLTDSQLAVVLDNALALLTCSSCGETRHVKDTGSHFFFVHYHLRRRSNGEGAETEAIFQPAASTYLQLLHDAITEAGVDANDATTADLEGLDKHFEVQLKSGSSITVDWRDLASGCYVTGAPWWRGRTTYDLVEEATSITYKAPSPSPAPQDSPAIPTSASTSGGTTG
ncbi:hypothetical protein NBRC10512_003617 [Rhodotorula toruloides]|uniref:RHTO0S13e01332g1_1 n=2 Tax=Rhodotorula toruloides TaxID=5286 RepID=A0A061BIE5_RHOTO|nr:uncharacterized protein RHTO_00808 [Rhodotorula toruloides NP11]EMS22529.1 hypothetical protein RHTO_00808 [Rhodotorula toruloides NP11]CDR46765.1 RHTO0S13e01332g1_1 [Rhodotorula toruloides]